MGVLPPGVGRVPRTGGADGLPVGHGVHGHWAPAPLVRVRATADLRYSRSAATRDMGAGADARMPP
jgi:hypothetical protein